MNIKPVTKIQTFQFLRNFIFIKLVRNFGGKCAIVYNYDFQLNNLLRKKGLKKISQWLRL